LLAERKPVPFKLILVLPSSPQRRPSRRGTDMNLQTKIHTTTDETWFPTMARSFRGVAARWLVPIALVVVAGTGIVGLNQLGASSRKPVTAVHPASNFEPLLIPEEQAFIDRIRQPLSSVAANLALQASTFEPLVISEEQAFIDGAYSRGSAENWCATHIPC
jgi:hypothetical protein